MGCRSVDLYHLLVLIGLINGELAWVLLIPKDIEPVGPSFASCSISLNLHGVEEILNSVLMNLDMDQLGDWDLASFNL